MTPANSGDDLPAHVADTVSAMARVHSDHELEASGLDRALARLTSGLGHPGFTPALVALVLGWIGLNLGLLAAGLNPTDPPPFVWLSGAAAVAALLMTGVLLTTQRREDRLATRREQLTLELAIVIDQKASKLIELLEKFRRDNPNVANHVDAEANAMSASADPQAVLDAIKRTHEPLTPTREGSAGGEEAPEGL